MQFHSFTPAESLLNRLLSSDKLKNCYHLFLQHEEQFTEVFVQRTGIETVRLLPLRQCETAVAARAEFEKR